MDDDAWIPPHRRLGIDEGADARTIRKAYAAKLKTVRPDADAAAFQRLVEARDAMLRWVDRSGAVDAAVPVAEPEPGAAPGDRSDGAHFEVAAGSPAAQVHLTGSVPRSPPAEPAEATASSDPAAEISADDTLGAEAVLEMLSRGLNHDTPLSRDEVEDVMARLPAGALRWVERDIIEHLSNATRHFERFISSDAVIEAYEIAFVRLADVFDWEARDRTIHETLSADDAHVLVVVLGRALRRHVPGYAGRYVRPRPAAPQVEEPRRLFSWRSAWAWGVIVMIVMQLARCVGETRTGALDPQPLAQARWVC